MGRHSSEGDPDGTIAYAYDHLGRATSVTQTIDGLTPDVELEYWYDAAGNQTYMEAYLGGNYNTANHHHRVIDAECNIQ